ncbi:hypothetical protein AgCh_010260 [Apium graveolens]
MTTVRCLLAIAAHKGWKLFQLDVNNAFLHGDLQEEVYMLVPPRMPNPHQKVCRLIKSLYGLRQASRQWFSKLVSELLYIGYTQSKNDYSLFIKKQADLITIVAVYVDDIILTGNDNHNINNLKVHLDKVFNIKDLGFLSYFLGLEIGYLSTGISLTQKKFTTKLLQAAGITDSKSVVTPLPLHLKLQADEGDLYHDPSHYRCLVGKLNFLTHTRPDLSFTVQHLSQFLKSPRIPHFQALSHVLKYVASTIGQGILLKGNEQLTLQAFSDSDWGACLNTRRSISGYILLLGNSPVSWKSKKQSVVSKSSSEAEYRSISAAASAVTWVVRLLEELGLLQITYLPTTSQLADVFTKILPSAHFKDLLDKLGMTSTLPRLRGDVDICDHLTTTSASTDLTSTSAYRHKSKEKDDEDVLVQDDEDEELRMSLEHQTTEYDSTWLPSKQSTFSEYEESTGSLYSKRKKEKEEADDISEDDESFHSASKRQQTSKLSKLADDLSLIKNYIRTQSGGIEVASESPLSVKIENAKINRDLKVPPIESFDGSSDPSDFINLFDGWIDFFGHSERLWEASSIPGLQKSNKAEVREDPKILKREVFEVLDNEKGLIVPEPRMHLQHFDHIRGVMTSFPILHHSEIVRGGTQIVKILERPRSSIQKKSVILAVLKADPSYRPPSPMNPNRPPSNKYCEYHEDTGHETEHCFQLTNLIEDKIRSGHLAHYMDDNHSRRSFHRDPDRVIDVILGGYSAGGSSNNSKKLYARDVC